MINPDSIVIPGHHPGSLSFLSDDYDQISSKLDSQICEEASTSSEEKVCCRVDDQQVAICMKIL